MRRSCGGDHVASKSRAHVPRLRGPGAILLCLGTGLHGPVPEPEETHKDLVEWNVLEPDAPIRFTRRFQGALARAAAALQAAQEAGEALPGEPLALQVETALGAFLGPKGKRAGLEHRAFVRAVHAAGLPEAVRKILGL